MRTSEDVQADLRSMRLTAQRLRADRHLDLAMQIEAVIAEREAELAAAVPPLPFTITEIASIMDHDHGREGVMITSGRHGVSVRITATAHGEHAQARAGWQALNRAIELLASIPLGDPTSSRMLRIVETWSWSSTLLTGDGEWVMDTARRES